MKTLNLAALACVLHLITPSLYGQVHRFYGAHITAANPWINRIVVHNNGNEKAEFRLSLWDVGGQLSLQQDHSVASNSSVALVIATYGSYVPAPGEVMLTPVEGTATLETASEKIRPKISYQYGDRPSLSEFFLQESKALEYVIPNPSYSHFSWLGLAVMNPDGEPLTVTLAAYQKGAAVDSHSETVPPHGKYVKLAGQIWPALSYSDFDQVKIHSTERAFPVPISISGNDAQDRHLFFNGASTASFSPPVAGRLYAVDSIAGTLRYLPSGTLIQGSPSTEPCRREHESQFAHTLTRSLAVMATEVTRGMWAELRSLRPELPPDPTDLLNGSGDKNPVQQVTWYEAVLFANLLSDARGLHRCYYMDAAFTEPLTASNYLVNEVYCNFAADGFRLPTEGEWEYLARAGTSTPFWVEEPAYNEQSCNTSCEAGTLPNAEAVMWFCANRADRAGPDTTKPVGLKPASPWGLHDVNGNVWEWCWDWYGPYDSGMITDYGGPASGTDRVIRGGASNNQVIAHRSAHRRYNLPGGRNSVFGFRLVRTINGVRLHFHQSP